MTGRPASDHRTIINGMLWVLRTGAPWRDLPKEKYGCHSTISSRFYRWRQAGVWQKIWETLMQQAHAEGRRDWEVHSGDTTVVRAPQHAAGAKGAAKAGFGSPGGFSTKVHIKSEGSGKPMAFVLTEGQRHEAIALVALLEKGKVKPWGRGRPKHRCRYFLKDTGGDGVLKGLRKPQATPPQLLRHRELSVSEIELND